MTNAAVVVHVHVHVVVVDHDLNQRMMTRMVVVVGT